MNGLFSSVFLMHAFYYMNQLVLNWIKIQKLNNNRSKEIPRTELKSRISKKNFYKILHFIRNGLLCVLIIFLD